MPDGEGLDWATVDRVITRAKSLREKHEAHVAWTRQIGG